MATKAKQSRTASRKPKERSLFSLVAGDGMVMGLWVFLSAIFEELSDMLAESLGVSPLIAGLTVLCTGLALYEPICTAVGGAGASFNPAINLALAAAGQGTFFSHSLRTAGQAVGGALGAWAALMAIPASWQGKFGNYAHGVMPGVSLLQGALSEAVLSFFLNLVILWTTATHHKRAAMLAPYVATIILIPAGMSYSGPFMNPAFAFSWFWHLRGADLVEHILVFWAGALAGSVAAGWLWSLITQPKKARRSQAALAASKRQAGKSQSKEPMTVPAGTPSKASKKAN